MLISVIVPVYNVKEYLAKCLQSILEQTYKNIELICVDDGSTDGSGAICDEYAERDARVRVAHKVNGGVSSARNAGIELAQGDYIAFVDSDDWLDLDYFEQAVAILEREHPVSLLNNFVRDYGNGVLVNKFLGASNAKVMNSEEAIYAICDNRFTGWEAVATFYVAKVCKEIRFNSAICFGEDLLFKWEFLKKTQGKHVYAPLVCYHYIKRTNSACNSYDLVRKADDLKVLEIIMAASDAKLENLLFAKEYFRRLAERVPKNLLSADKKEKQIAREMKQKLVFYFLRALFCNEIAKKTKLKACACMLPECLIKYIVAVYKIFKI